MNDLELYQPKPDSRSLIAHDPVIQTEEKVDGVHLAALIAAFRRHLWLFTAIALAVIVVTIALTLLETPMYVATARVAINTREVQVAPASISGAANAPVVSSIPDESSAVDTEVAVVSSRDVAERVVTGMHLDQDPEFSLSQAEAHLGVLGRLKRALSSIFAGSKALAKPSAAAETDYAVNAVLARLKVMRFNLTSAIDISFGDPDRNKAAMIANAFAQAYIGEQIESKFETDQQAGNFLKGRISQMLQQYLSDETKLQQYKIAHNLMSSGATTLTEQEISTYNESVVQAKAEAAADQANLDTAKAQLAGGSNGEDVGEALSSAVIQSLRSQRAALSEHVADLQSRYGDKYPALLVAQQQLADIDHQIQAEINRVISNLEAKAQVSRRRLESIEGSVASTKAVLSQNNEAQVGLDQLQQNSDASQSLYQSYLNRLKETAAQEGGEQSDARVLSNAPTPERPTTPRVWLNILLGVVLGVGCGLAAVVVSEMVDTGITTADDVERRLGRRCLGGIPLLSSVDGYNGASPLDEIVQAPYSAFSESFRNLRASISYAIPGEHPRVVAITSALPKEGKTTAAICLARSAALQGVRTVLVDCDIRRRGINQILSDTDDRPGLFEILTGAATIVDTLIVDAASGAMIIPISRAKTPKQDMFGSEAMDELVAELRRQFEFVVLDSPPLLPVADARVIATKADAVVLMTRWRKTGSPAIKTAIRLLPHHQVKLAGIVITQVNMQKQSRYGYGDPAFYYRQYKEYYS